MHSNQSTDNIHWSLSRAIENNVTDDSSLWQGNVVGDGVELDTEVMSLQGRGHVILGRFDDFCPGNPSLCEEGFTVSFWMKHGGKTKRENMHRFHDLLRIHRFVFLLC